MSTSNSFYLNALFSQGNSTDRESFTEQMRGSPLSFTVAEVDYKIYHDEHYDDELWEGRRVLAIPSALISGVIATITHLACGLLLGPLAMLLDLEDGTKLFKGMMFCVARDLQETFAHIVTLFHDAYGLYHVEEAEFHKSCYYLSLDKVKHQSDDNTSPPNRQTSFQNQEGYDSVVRREQVKREAMLENTRREQEQKYEVQGQEAKDKYEKEKEVLEKAIADAPQAIRAAQAKLDNLPADADVEQNALAQCELLEAQRQEQVARLKLENLEGAHQAKMTLLARALQLNNTLAGPGAVERWGFGGNNAT